MVVALALGFSVVMGGWGPCLKAIPTEARSQTPGMVQGALQGTDPASPHPQPHHSPLSPALLTSNSGTLETLHPWGSSHLLTSRPERSLLASRGLPFREASLTSHHLARRSGPGHALSASTPSSVARSHRPPSVHGLGARREWYLSVWLISGSGTAPGRGTCRFLLDGWIFLCRSEGQPHLLGARWPLPGSPWPETPRVSSQKRRLYSHLGLPSKLSKPVQERRGSECPRDGKSASGAGVWPVPGGPGISRVCSMQCPPSSVPRSVGMSSSDEVLVGGSGPGGLTWSDLGSWPGSGG